ncbi:MAG UNVERIFIED_CONTAM: hypothetical protein LVT10_03140 [Anaerolineae bacterium]|jgi:hypothetical protein
MSYEFSEAQNQKFRKLTRSMNRVVILLFLVGLNALIQYYFDVVEYQRNLTLLLEGLAYLLSPSWFIFPFHDLRRFSPRVDAMLKS